MKVRFAVAPPSGIASSNDLLGFLDALETSEFDGIWLSDLPASPALDPLLGLALAAGRTARLRLGANLVALGRNPFLLAKQLAQLDQLSGGRLLLSFVTGLRQPGERQALGLNGANRGALLEESLGLLRTWWAGRPVDHGGDRGSVDHGGDRWSVDHGGDRWSVDHGADRWSFTGLAPAARPVQEPLEVWLGGRGPKALDRVGRVADGWLGAQLTPAEAKAARELIQARADRAGREIDPEHFGLSIAYARATPDRELLRAVGSRRPDIDPLALVPVGERGLRELIQRYIEAGLSKFVVRPVAGVRAWTDEASWLTEAILDLQT